MSAVTSQLDSSDFSAQEETDVAFHCISKMNCILQVNCRCGNSNL